MIRTLSEVIKTHVAHVLAQHHGNKVAAAKALGVSRWTVARILKKIDAGDDVEAFSLLSDDPETVAARRRNLAIDAELVEGGG